MATWRAAKIEASQPSAVLFLDRDGVVIVDQDYLSNPAEVILLPGAAATIKLAHEVGLIVIGVSNQSGLGRGLFAETDFAKVMTRLDSLLAEQGAFFDGFYYCPHGPDDDCNCRKPRTGLLDEAAQNLTWDPAVSWVVGDKESDVALARRGELGGVLVSTGYGQEQLAAVQRKYAGDEWVLHAADLPAALQMILANQTMKKWSTDR